MSNAPNNLNDPNYWAKHSTAPNKPTWDPSTNDQRAPPDLDSNLPGIRSTAANLPVSTNGWGPEWRQGADGRWYLS